MSIFVVVKERVVNSKRIFMLFLHICLSFFGVFIRAILERAAIFIMLLQFVNQSIFVPAIYLPICLYEVICPSFLKIVFSAEAVLFIKTVYREIHIQTKALYELCWVV